MHCSCTRHGVRFVLPTADLAVDIYRGRLASVCIILAEHFVEVCEMVKSRGSHSYASRACGSS
jgi:hypothetical protein